MSAEALAVAAATDEGCHLFGTNGCGFDEVVPSVSVFFPEAWLTFGLPGTAGIGKYTLMLVLSVLVVVGFWHFATRKASVVPGRLQSTAELLITFLRDNVTRVTMGKDGDKYLPLMVSLFLFLFTMNVMGIIPPFQLPVTSHIAFPAALAIYMYITWNALGIRKYGVVGHFVGRVVPPGGAPKWIWPLLIPIEISYQFVAKPATHALRPFAAMLSGHLLLAVFAAGGFYMFNIWAPEWYQSVLSVGYSAVALIAFVAFTGFELFIMALQAYVFVMLASFYLGEVMEGAH